MEIWKRNLIICWVGMFITAVGTSQLAPILPLYINELGVHNTATVEFVAGLTFGGTFIVMAIFSPIWGKAADKYGRKPMLLRASLGMTIVIGSLALVQNVYQLVFIRMLQGVISGYTTACTTLIATQVDKDNSGFALGTLATSSIAGTLLGPSIGGYLSELVGIRPMFVIIAILMFIVFLTSLAFVKEEFVPVYDEVPGIKKIWKSIPNTCFLATLFLTGFILQLALYSIEPIITIYITQISETSTHIALIAGIVFSASGLASMLSAPVLGRISDRVGNEKVIFICLIVAAIVFIPQAFVNTPYQLMFLRFLLGLATAGLTPSISSLTKKSTPDKYVGRVFGIGTSCQYLGVFCGSLLGGFIAGSLGIRYIFYVTSGLLLINSVIVYNFIYKKSQ